MKYLVIGDANSMHIYNFVRTVLLPKNYEVFLFTLSARRLRGEYLNFYLENKVKLFSIAENEEKDLSKKDIFYRIINLIKKVKLFKKIPDVDICHVHSVYPTSIWLALFNKKKYRHLILSYWGGDIEDRRKNTIKIRQKCFKYADVITVTVKQTYSDFQSIYGNKYNNKLYICRFATDGLNCIKHLSETITRMQCRNAYNIKNNEICITCGYSAYASQHQDIALEKIKMLPKPIKEKLCVIVPMQYGRYDQAYINLIDNIVKTCDFKCMVLDKFVTFEMSAKLAIATDIYLHLRDTDAFSNALKEHVYANSFIIKGDWLRYPELEEMGARVKSINSFDNLNNALQEAINRIETGENKIKLFSPIYDLYSTESIICQWNNVINNIYK